ncbi:universal stress protein UspA-like protein [Halovivax ruber XH-70]|uniref:Universal stress protein UspA-like protein n=1 Tax=Halovivax ruber (strain DSM 18193 / JCM 13892 / XH-70) TaxID=797302 RepID=L0I920_HALRX|nr:universal stress protein [Halovivax ruber]AGB15209.1 universal stress protein UspA-like protein [Halovivax ruber XH-70]
MNVLLGLGGTDESIQALEATIDRASAVGDELVVAILDKADAPRSPAEMRSETAATLEAAGFDADIRELEGDPGPALVELAEREGFDHVVIGGGTETPMGKIRLGPITEFVLLNASMPVTLIR